MKRRKGLAFILALSLVLSSFSVAFATDVAEETTPVTETTTEAVAPVATATNTAFADIAGHWAKDAIVKWADYGVVKGSDGVFRPDAPLTRAEMATVLSNLMDYKVAAKNNFSDVATGAWYADAVLKANAAGVLSGDGSGLASPSANITREQATSMLARAFAVADANGTSSSLTDTQNISSWARPAVFGMEAAGYVRGFEGKFNPKNNITRAEVITIINSAVKAYYTAAGTYTENVDGLAVVKVPGVVLKDVVISGNLIAAEGIASGDLTLDGKTEVKGKLIVRGGGENSIIIKGSAAVLSIEVSKVDGKVRIFADGALIKEITALKGEIILEGNFTNVEVKADATVIIKGNVGILSMESKGTVDIQSGTVTTLDIPAGATATVAANATVTTANITGAADIKGTGAIGTANISGTGATIVQTPTAVNVADGGAATVGGKTVDGATSAAPSTGGGRGNSSNTVAVSAITVTSQGDATTVVNGKTLQMGVVIGPDDASNKKVTWSIETGGTGSATINTSGLLTATKVGTVTVKALAQDGSGEFGTKEITIHADLTAYNAALAAVTEANYTTDSWATYQSVVTANVVTVTDKQADVDAATLAITNAQADLVIPVTGISISGESAVAKDEKLQLSATVTPYNASDKKVTWSIETGGTGSATIEQNGELTGTSEGTVTVKVVSQYDTSITATKEITVTASKLDAAKANAKTDLDTYVDATDYAINNATELATAISDGKTAIDSASDIAGVTTALVDAKSAIDAIKTDAQIAAEELATEKTNAKTELENYKVAANYTRNAAALSTAIENGKTAIDNATDIAGVTTALANAKAVIDDIKTDEALNDADIAIAKSNIEAASYTATQVEITDAALALSKAQALVNELELKGTTATVVAGTFTGAVAGDSSTPAGTNGSYTFTVTIAKGSGTQETTTEQTMTITATPYDSTAQDNADITSAKTNIESATYTATQAEASDSAKALTKAQALVNALGTELKGTSVNVIAGTFTGAITGTEASVYGTNGSFSFTVEISKDKGTTLTTDVQTMTITATKYDPTQDNADIVTAKTNIEGATYTTTQADVDNKTSALAKVETIISGLDTAGTIVEVVPGSFSGAIAGVEGVFDPTDGSYTFTVKINKGGGAETITKELTLTITATEPIPVSKASKVEVNGDKKLDSSNPYLVNGEPAASGTLGSADCTAHFDSSTGVLTLQGYNGAEIRTLYESNPDLIIKLIGNNTVTTTNSSMGIYNGNYGNIYITSDSGATLNVNSTSDNNYVYAIATNHTGGKSIIIGGEAKVTVTAKTTAASQNASVAHANKDFIIQDNASFIGESTATASGSYAVFTKEKIIINTTGNVDIDCSASSGSYAFNGMNGVDIKNVTLMTLKKATNGSFIAGSKNLSRVAVNIKDNNATYRGGTPYELKVSNGQITAVQVGQIGVPYQGLENDEITITANTIVNFEFVKWTNGDGTDIDSSVIFLEGTDVNSSEAKIKMPAKDLNIKAEYKSTLFTEQPSFHRGEKKIKWSVGEATFSGSGDSFKLQKKTSGEWEVKTYPFINSTDAKNGYIEVNNNSSSHTLYTPDGNYRLYFKVDGKDHYSEEFVVEWEDTINISAIPGVTAPVTGETPATTITATDQYTGTVTWSPTATKFAGDTAYTATITLVPKTGFKLDGVAADYFTVAGATTVNNAANLGVVTAVFPKTGAALSGDATLTSTMGTVDNSAETIVDIPYNTSLENFKAAITPASGGSFEVYEADGTTKATDLASGYKVIVTAEDTTTTKTYTITVKSEHFANGSGTLEDPYKVSSAEELNNVRHYLGTTNKNVYFKQTQDINLNVTPWNTGEGWVPIGVNTDSRFNGKYDGDNKIISGIRINRPAEDYQGLFGTVGYEGTLININLTDVDIKGKNNVGGLVGDFINGAIENCSATGIIEGAEKTGGLVGYHNYGTIRKSYSTCTVTGTRIVGGLAGYSSSGSIEKSYAIGNVTGSGDMIGGLIGYNGNPVTNCYATGDVEGTSPIGGLIGKSFGASITNSYAIGKVTKTGGATSGGLVDSFSAGETSATVGSSYYDTTTSGQSDTGKGVPKTTGNMAKQATFIDWNFTESTGVWKINEDSSYPYLQWQGTENIPEIPAAQSSDASLSDLKVAGTTVTDFAANKLTYNVELPADTATAPTVLATVTDSKANATVAPASSLPGATTIEVTAEDGTTKQTYTINFILKQAAPTDLTGVAPTTDGGADGKIEGTTAKMEYKLASEEDTAYVAAMDSETTGLEAGGYVVRYAAKDGYKESPATSVTVSAYVAPATLESIAITTPASKLIYKIGEALDITGMVVTGTYSDSTTKIETITIDNVSGFNNSAVVASQELTVTVDGKMTSYIISVEKADGPAAPLVESFKTSGSVDDMIMLKNDGTDFTIKVGTNMIGHEYSINDGSNWVDLNASGEEIIISGTSILIRVKETATHNPGEAAKVILTTEGYVFNINTGTILSYAGTEKDLSIPSKIGEISVTKIDDNAFGGVELSDGKDLTSVEIPETVITIGNFAFMNNALTSIVIPDSVTYLGTNAFQYNKLIEVTISKLITTMGFNVFQNNGTNKDSEDIPKTDYVGTWRLLDGSKTWTKD